MTIIDGRAKFEKGRTSLAIRLNVEMMKYFERIAAKKDNMPLNQLASQIIECFVAEDRMYDRLNKAHEEE